MPLFLVYFVVEDFRDKLDSKNYNVYCQLNEDFFKYTEKK
jgi:hypothetical protein